MTAGLLDGPDSFGAFASFIASRLRLPIDRLSPSARLLADLHLDELALAELFLAVGDLNPYFEIPAQVSINAVTVADIHHFACTMTEDHVEGIGW